MAESFLVVRRCLTKLALRTQCCQKQPLLVTRATEDVHAHVFFLDLVTSGSQYLAPRLILSKPKGLFVPNKPVAFWHAHTKNTPFRTKDDVPAILSIGLVQGASRYQGEETLFFPTVPPTSAAVSVGVPGENTTNCLPYNCLR